MLYPYLDSKKVRPLWYLILGVSEVAWRPSVKRLCYVLSERKESMLAGWRWWAAWEKENYFPRGELVPACGPFSCEQGEPRGLPEQLGLQMPELLAEAKLHVPAWPGNAKPPIFMRTSWAWTLSIFTENGMDWWWEGSLQIWGPGKVPWHLWMTLRAMEGNTSNNRNCISCHSVASDRDHIWFRETNVTSSLSINIIKLTICTDL